MVMSKTKVRIIGSRAKKLMIADFDKGAEVAIKNVSRKSLPYVYYHIFEDANFHSLNKALEEKGAFIGTYGGAQDDFDDYRKAGGETWKLT